MPFPLSDGSKPSQNPFSFSKYTSKASLVSTQEVDGQTSGNGSPWRPWTLTAKILIPTALFTALLILAIALLQWQDSLHGALCFAKTTDGFSDMDLFLYRYLPTIVIVLYGILWSWIDLDIKRLEPWFQMAKDVGANGSSSLLLQYPAEFLPLVPFKAARQRLVRHSISARNHI
jgi:Protein of unknown function (DUF3433)